jgi:tetratricopeptide (TPR) repeat protein
MSRLALELRHHYHDTSGEEQTLDEAADMAEKATIITLDQDPNLPRYYNDLGLILWDQHHQSGCYDTLEYAIKAVRQAVDLAPKIDLERLRYLDNLSYMLYDQGNLRESFEAAKEVVQNCPDTHEHSPEYVDHFGRLLYDLSIETESIYELEQGLDTVRQSVNSMPNDHSGKAQCLSTLARLLHEQYGFRRGNLDPTEAVQVARDAVAAVSEEGLEKATYLNRLGYVLLETFHFTRAMGDIEESVKLLRQATTEFYDDDNDWDSRSFNLGTALAARSAATGSLEDLNEAIAIAQEVLEISPDDDERRLKRSLYLASRLKERYVWTGSISDFNEAIKVVNANLALAPEDNPSRGHAFHILGNAMGDRHSMTGSMDDLDEAIKLAQKAVEVTPATDTEWPNFLSSLASGFADRFDRTARLADLDEAIRLWERALEESPETNLSWIGLVYNLVGSYKDRYLRLGRVLDLERSVELGQTTVDKCGRGDSNRHLYLSSLAGALKMRFDLSHAVEDLNTAIDLERKALEATPTDHVDYPSHLHALGTSMSRKYRQTKDIADLEEAISSVKRALDIMDEGHRRRAESLFDMGLYLQRRGVAVDSEGDKREAAQYYQKAMSQTQSSVQVRIEAARSVMYLYMTLSEWQLAYEAAVVAIDLIPQLILRSLGNVDKQELLKKIGGLSSEAAGLVLQLGKGSMVALDMLERGRGLLASSLDDLHADIDDLRNECPALAERFVSLRDRLGQEDISQRESTFAWNNDSNRRHEAGEEFDKLVAEIRHQPGFEDFLLPPTENKVKQAAESGPIIVVNTCLVRCDAIVIEPHQIRAVLLPHFRRQDMTRFIKEGTLRSSLALEWLWDCIASPILDALGLTKTPDSDWPHVWWVMTGLLTKFPIHAAGYQAKDSTNTVLDRVVSSYQTSVQSIIRGRKRPIGARLQQALLVGMEMTPGSSYLPNASNEVVAVRQVCESMSIKTVEPKPVKADITAQLLQSEVFHYAGHAYTDGRNPSESYLCLEANKADCLTVSNLLDINLQRKSPFLAYLSACGTGEIQNEDLSDEGIHLITAFQLLGFRHVIGTLWAVMDSLCVQFARLLYQHLRDYGTTDRAVAEGLHHATRKLRGSWLDTDSTERKLSERRKNKSTYETVENEETRENTRSVGMRDVVACEDDVAWPDWIPYVHFGV